MTAPATTFMQIKKEVVRLVGDLIAYEDDQTTIKSPLAGSIYSADLLQDAVHAAIRRVSQRHWKTAIYSNTVAGTVFPLPDDYLDIEGVFDVALGMFLPRLPFPTGVSFAGTQGGSNAWINYPGKQITLMSTTVEGKGVKIYYMAHWTLPIADAEVLECPAFCDTSIALYAASYSLLKTAAESGDTAQYKTKVDSGRPTDIPAQALSDFFMKRLENEMSSFPVMTRNT